MMGKHAKQLEATEQASKRGSIYYKKGQKASREKNHESICYFNLVIVCCLFGYNWFFEDQKCPIIFQRNTTN